jgi:hypothetical protein
VVASDDAVELSLVSTAPARVEPMAAWSGGDGTVGELGDGTQQDRVEPAEALGITDATRIYTGYLRRCAIRAGGELRAGAPRQIPSPRESRR